MNPRALEHLKNFASPQKLNKNTCINDLIYLDVDQLPDDLNTFLGFNIQTLISTLERNEQESISEDDAAEVQTAKTRQYLARLKLLRQQMLEQIQTSRELLQKIIGTVRTHSINGQYGQFYREYREHGWLDAVTNPIQEKCKELLPRLEALAKQQTNFAQLFDEKYQQELIKLFLPPRTSTITIRIWYRTPPGEHKKRLGFDTDGHISVAVNDHEGKLFYASFYPNVSGGALSDQSQLNNLLSQNLHIPENKDYPGLFVELDGDAKRLYELKTNDKGEQYHHYQYYEEVVIDCPPADPFLPALCTAISDAKENPQIYNPFKNNCATFIRNLLQAAGADKLVRFPYYLRNIISLEQARAVFPQEVFAYIQMLKKELERRAFANESSKIEDQKVDKEYYHLVIKLILIQIGACLAAKNIGASNKDEIDDTDKVAILFNKMQEDFTELLRADSCNDFEFRSQLITVLERYNFELLDLPTSTADYQLISATLTHVLNDVRNSIVQNFLISNKSNCVRAGLGIEKAPVDARSPSAPRSRRPAAYELETDKIIKKNLNADSATFNLPREEQPLLLVHRVYQWSNCIDDIAKLRIDKIIQIQTQQRELDKLLHPQRKWLGLMKQKINHEAVEILKRDILKNTTEEQYYRTAILKIHEAIGGTNAFLYFDYAFQEKDSLLTSMDAFFPKKNLPDLGEGREKPHKEEKTFAVAVEKGVQFFKVTNEELGNRPSLFSSHARDQWLLTKTRMEIGIILKNPVFSYHEKLGRIHWLIQNRRPYHFFGLNHTLRAQYKELECQARLVCLFDAFQKGMPVTQFLAGLEAIHKSYPKGPATNTRREALGEFIQKLESKYKENTLSYADNIERTHEKLDARLDASLGTYANKFKYLMQVSTLNKGLKKVLVKVKPYMGPSSGKHMPAEIPKANAEKLDDLITVEKAYEQHKRKTIVRGVR